MDERSLVRRRLQPHRAITEPQLFTMAGRTWDLLPGVFAPMFTGTAEFFARAVPFPVGGSFLEIGSGAGVIAVTAALNGCGRVTATDLCPQAVANTVLNAERHGVRDIVGTGCGDMYEPVGADRYDLIFWNSGARFTERAWPETEGLGRAVSDPGYTAHGAYLAQARQHLTPHGRLMLGFADAGDPARLHAIARQYRWHLTRLETMTFPNGQGTSDFLEFLPCPRMPGADACPACP